MKNIAIFASGSGTNAENIIRYFSTKKNARVKLVLSNRRNAMVLKRAEDLKVDTFFFDRNDFYTTGKVADTLSAYDIDFVVLAGFLWLVPDNIIESFEGKIVNIHPALLPKFGGKGMYGEAVHKAVVSGKEKESGITIHYVNRHYDSGDIIFQAKCSVKPDDTAETLALRIHELEYLHFPRVIDELVSSI